MRFQNPEAFLLLLVLTALYAWRYYSRKKATRISAPLPTLSNTKRIPAPLSVKLRALPKILTGLSLVLLVTAPARPQTVSEKVNRSIEGVDIVVALDVSSSMLGEDMGKGMNRFNAAKLVISRFIDGRTNDRIGLVVFSGESFTRVPLTIDYRVVKKALNELSINLTQSFIAQGTAIGVAIVNAVARLRDSRAKSRILILLTDGDNNTGTIDPETAADIAEGFGIKVYTIGVGREGRIRIPVTVQDPFGRKRKSYQSFNSSINEDLLKSIAERTGGRFYRATSASTLAKIFRTIDKLERSRIEVTKYVKYKEEFPAFIYLFLVLWTFSLILSATKLRVLP
jgi:Ca-activated chloride channel family protein